MAPRSTGPPPTPWCTGTRSPSQLSSRCWPPGQMRSSWRWDYRYGVHPHRHIWLHLVQRAQAAWRPRKCSAWLQARRKRQAPMGQIVLDHVTKEYPVRVKGNDDLSLDMADGEF